MVENGISHATSLFLRVNCLSVSSRYFEEVCMELTLASDNRLLTQNVWASSVIVFLSFGLFLFFSNDPRLEGILQNAVRRSLQEMGDRCVQELEKEVRPATWSWTARTYSAIIDLDMKNSGSKILFQCLISHLNFDSYIDNLAGKEW